MTSVFEAYRQLFAVETHAALASLLSKIPVMHYPEDRSRLNTVVPSYVVLVIREATVSEIINLVEMGFEHCVRAGREDFAQELVAASLMTIKPEAFVRNPLPFFFDGFKGPDPKDPDKNLTLKIQNSAEKATLLDWLDVFLQQNPRTSGVRELCVQSADEMITNALYNAPIRPSGVRPYESWSRAQAVELPAAQAATLFACFSDERVIVGCTDPFGSLGRESLLGHLRHAFRDPLLKLRTGEAGAGLGFRYLIENSANFYLISQPRRRTLVACGFLLKGLRANLNVAKHFHFSFT